jgi:hypothetical protein
MGFLNHIRVLNIKIISQINLFLIFLKKTIDKYKIKSNFMCFSVALFYNYFLCGKRAFLCGESNSSFCQKMLKNRLFLKIDYFFRFNALEAYLITVLGKIRCRIRIFGQF